MKEYTVKLTEKELQTIICALQIAEDNADDIDAYDVEFDGKKYTHSEFEEDCNDYREWLAGLKPKEVNNGL